MLSLPADTAEGLKEGTQPLQRLRRTDSGTVNNTYYDTGMQAAWIHAHTHKPDCRQSLKTVIGYVEKDVPGELAAIGTDLFRGFSLTSFNLK